MTVITEKEENKIFWFLLKQNSTHIKYISLLLVLSQYISTQYMGILVSVKVC